MGVQLKEALFNNTVPELVFNYYHEVIRSNWVKIEKTVSTELRTQYEAIKNLDLTTATITPDHCHTIGKIVGMIVVEIAEELATGGVSSFKHLFKTKSLKAFLDELLGKTIVKSISAKEVKEKLESLGIKKIDDDEAEEFAQWLNKNSKEGDDWGKKFEEWKGKKVGGVDIESSAWSYLIKQGIGDEALNLLIKEFGNAGNISNNAFINLRRNLRNKTLTMEDLKTKSDAFKRWIEDYKNIINNIEPFEWGLRFLLKQDGFEKIELTTMKKLFVDAFPTSVRRAKIYEDYLQYINELKTIIGKDTKFTQLTFGSFVRDKIDAGDMDFVIFIPESIFYKNEDKIKNLNKIYKSKFFNNEKTLDVTATAIFPKNHEKYESKFGEELYYMLKKYATSDKQNIPQKTFILEF